MLISCDELCYSALYIDTSNEKCSIYEQVDLSYRYADGEVPPQSKRNTRCRVLSCTLP
jgi:hypothetical protein